MFTQHSLRISTFLIFMLMAWPSYAETLEEAVEMALNNHPSIEAALALRNAAIESQKEERSGFFPEVSASATGGRIFGDNSTSRGLVTTRGEAYSYLWEGNASVTQPIFDGFETWNRFDAAKARRQSANFDVIDIRENLALQTAQAYLSVLRTQKSLQAIQDYEKTIQDYIDRIKALVEDGAADTSEISQAENIRLLLKETEAEFKGQVKSALATYAELVGRLPESDLTEPLPHTDFDDLERAVSYARENHPFVLSTQQASFAEREEINAERGVLYPDLDAELSYLKRDQREEIGGEVEDRRAILRLSWEFSTGGAQLARVRRSKAEYSETLAQSREAMRQVEREVRLAHAELETAKAQKEVAEERLKITQDLFETNKEQFEGARMTLLQLLQIDNQLFSARLEDLTAKYRVLTAQYTLMASQGRLQKMLNIVPASSKQ